MSQRFAVGLVEHESSNLGGVYLLGSDPLAESVTVQTNFEDEDGYLAEPDFAGYPTLVYIVQNAEFGGDAFQDDPRLTVLRVEEL